MKKQLHALKCRDSPPPGPLGASHYRTFSIMKEWPSAHPQQPANPTGHHTGWPLLGYPLPHSVNPFSGYALPKESNTTENKSSRTASLRRNTHINTNIQHNIPVKALGSMSIQGNPRQHLIDGSVPNLVCAWAPILVSH